MLDLAWVQKGGRGFQKVLTARTLIIEDRLGIGFSRRKECGSQCVDLRAVWEVVDIYLWIRKSPARADTFAGP